MSRKLDKFCRYLERYQKAVKKNASNFVEIQLAEDVAQDTFMKMYMHLDHLNDENVLPWLLVVSANIAKDYVKQGGAYKTVSMTPEDLLEHAEKSDKFAENNNIEKELRRKAALKLLQTACDLLYEKNKDWYYVEIDSCMLGMSSRQIAEALNLSVANVDVIKSRARVYLRRKLGKEYEEIFN